jgi:outer membrane immunogenic protein
MQSKVKYGLMAIGSAVLGAIIFTTYAAKAADNGGKLVSRAAAEAAAPTNAWAGCGLGVFGGWLSGGIDTGTPITIGAEGMNAGAHVGCDWQSGRGVIGATASYGWVFGDLKTVGLNTTMSVGARAGYLVTPSALAYVLANWNRVDTDGGNVDGYGIGGGIELKLPDAPIFVALQYEHGFYSNVLGITGLDAGTNIVTFRTTYKFNTMAR